MLLKLKHKTLNFRVRLFHLACRMLGLRDHYHDALRDAALEIGRLSAEVKRIDNKNALDVRSSLDVVNFDSLGDVVWIKVTDDRMLRSSVFSQIKDYMRGHGKEHAILVVTKSDVDLRALTDKDLMDCGLRRMLPSERN